VTVSVYRSIRSPAALGADWPRHFLLDLARAMSAHSGWRIIDSYALSAVPDRVNGDPIVNNLWGGLDETGLNSNSWFVAEQVNPETGFPAMQIKFQGTGAGAFDDCSGNDYGWEGTTRIMAVRLAPFGGWDLAVSNPDFANPSKVSKNFSIESVGTRWFFVIDDDFVLMPQCNGFAWDNVSCYIGAYNPMTQNQHAPDHPCYMYYGLDANSQYLDGFWSNEQTPWFFTDRQGYNYYVVSCPDENGDMKRWNIHCPPLGYFWSKTMYPNEFDADSSIDLIEVPISGVEIAGQPDSPDTRMIGSHKHVWFGFGPGDGVFLEGKQYRTLGGNKPCMVIPWGDSDVNPF